MSEQINVGEQSAYDRRTHKIARRLAKRAIRAAKSDHPSIDVRGPLNMRRVYRRMSTKVYNDSVYSNVNEKLSDQGLNVTRTSASISYWGIGCYMFGHNIETVKHYDRMHISKLPPSNGDGDNHPSDPDGPDFGKELPLYVPEEWLEIQPESDIPDHTQEYVEINNSNRL